MGVKSEHVLDRFMVVAGFNTKQYWIYDEMHDAYIDPPADVIENLSVWESKDAEKLEVLVAQNPDWLYDKAYTYSDLDFEI